MKSQLSQQQNKSTSGVIMDPAGVSFTDGVMQVHGRDQRPVRVQQWQSSNGLTVYTCVLWADPSTDEQRVSCNCPGWTKRAARECCHTLDMAGVKECAKTKIRAIDIVSVETAVACVPDLTPAAARRVVCI